MASYTIDVERPKKRARTSSHVDLTTDTPHSGHALDAGDDHGGTESVAARERRFEELYQHPPNFQQLARRDADFAVFVKGRRELDFQDPAAVLQLTKTLLRVDFGLDLEMPGDRLCPPVANRHNYILWLKKLMDSTTADVYEGRTEGEVEERPVRGLDIGTGASCIYPLLGCTQRPSWSFTATDIDATSLDWARKNVARNDLAHRIEILSRSPSDPLVPPSSLPLDFTMTNPPFYASPEDLAASAEKKSLPPLTACTGSPAEMVTPGGEVAFAVRLIEESLELKRQVRWYTTMLGFLSSVSAVVARLREEKVENYAVTEFVQGRKTRRWAVGWSFGGMRPDEKVARGLTGGGTGEGRFPRMLLPMQTEVEVVEYAFMENFDTFYKAFERKFGRLELALWKWDEARLEGVGRVRGRVWGRAWRRMRQRAWERDREGESDASKEMFGFRVQLRWPGGAEDIPVVVRWLEGEDPSVFESFLALAKANAEAAWGDAWFAIHETKNKAAGRDSRAG